MEPTLPPHARLWLYQAGRELSPAETAQVEQTLAGFVESWASHGQPLAAAAQVLHRRFVAVAVDQLQAAPSGCSIDKSVALLRQLGQQLGTDFFDRTTVAYRDAQGHIATLKMGELKTAVAQGLLRPETVVFNLLAERWGDLATQLEVPAAQTWLARYFKPQLAA
ncbi:MAG: hypothetical protein MUC97_00295 [Bernardetiaceae bacterium]|jgi:hypothetical protein|nr:hypothetical protein [Bernardetiaceae bacterium]